MAENEKNKEFIKNLDEKYLKVMFGNKSYFGDKEFEYKIDEINETDFWNPDDVKNTGGFNFSNEKSILRWLVRGDTLYDVEVPKDAECVECPSPSSPRGVFRTNKIILKNPRKVTDEVAMELYLKSELPEKSYYKALAGLAIRGYENTCMRLIRDRINKENIQLVLGEIADFYVPSSNDENANLKVYNKIMGILNEISQVS